jgi:uncharacterized protein (UPF0297 family)
MDIYATMFIVLMLGVFIVSLPRIIKEFKNDKRAKHYTKDDQEIKLIRNFLIESGLFIDDKPIQSIKSLIINNSEFAHYNWIKIEYVIDLGNECYFIMTKVSYNTFVDEGYPEFIENQIVGYLSKGDKKMMIKSSKKATLKEAKEIIMRIKNNVS